MQEVVGVATHRDSDDRRDLESKGENQVADTVQPICQVHVFVVVLRKTDHKNGADGIARAHDEQLRPGRLRCQKWTACRAPGSPLGILPLSAKEFDLTGHFLSVVLRACSQTGNVRRCVIVGPRLISDSLRPEPSRRIKSEPQQSLER
jgi:hypothetical protein